MCTWQFISPEEANSCDLSMPWLWNFLLLMLYGKRNLFLLDCTSDSWQMTLSLCFSGAETKSRTGFLPNLFEFARDVADACFHRCDKRTYWFHPCLICLAIGLFQKYKNQKVAVISCGCPLELRNSHARVFVALGPRHDDSCCGSQIWINTQVMRV